MSTPPVNPFPPKKTPPHQDEISEKTWFDQEVEKKNGDDKISEIFFDQQLNRVLNGPSSVDAKTFIEKIHPADPFDEFDPQIFEERQSFNTRKS